MNEEHSISVNDVLGALVSQANSHESEGRYEQALGVWDSLRAQCPDSVEGYSGAGSVLRKLGRFEQAEQLLANALTKAPDHELALVEYAAVAKEQMQWAETLRRAEFAIERYPYQRTARRYAAHALMELARQRDAISVLSPALRMYPDDVDLCVLNAWLATQGDDIDAAVETWRDVLRRFEDRVDAYHGLAVTLQAANRLDDAEKVLQQAADRFPDNIVVVAECARVAERQSNWTLAVQRWQGLSERFPEDPEVQSGLRNCLAQLEAGKISSAGQAPAEANIYLAEARAATASKDWPTAAEMWSAFASEYPDDVRGFVGFGQMLRESGRIQDSVRVLSGALSHFPGRVDLEVELAWSLSAQRSWPKALALWASLKRRLPHDHGIQSSIVNVLGHAVADQGAHGVQTFEIPESLQAFVNSGETQESALVLKRFESLGDSCEFGILQRQFQVEELSLLRWSYTTPDNLIAALNSRFEGVGDEAYTLIKNNGHEYTTEDTRYHMHSHTFTSPAVEPIELFVPDQCRRLRWLRRKLIDSLAAAKKIFVYKSGLGVTDRQLDALFRSIQSYSSNNKFLCVRLQDENPAGSVVAIRPNLFVAYIDRFSNVNVSEAIWMQICRRVVELVDGSPKQAPVNTP